MIRWHASHAEAPLWLNIVNKLFSNVHEIWKSGSQQLPIELFSSEP